MRATIEARRILEHFCVADPHHISLVDLCAYYNAHIEVKELTGSEGRITHNGRNAVIAIDKKITNIHRKNFIIAHELGHFRLHNNASKVFVCEGIDFFSWQKLDDRETEANIFAAELLMPTQLFQNYTKGKKLNIDLIKDTAEYFNTSITSTIVRYAKIGNHPCAMVFCQNGKILWAVINEIFPLKFISLNKPVNSLSYSSDYFLGNEIPLGPELIPCDAWFRNDYRFQPNTMIIEQCFPLPKYNAVICLLWFD